MSHQHPSIPIRGASGAEYRFNLFPWGQQFNAFGAVYVVLRHDGNNRYSVLYFGQTRDMGERFDNHHKQWCFDQNGKTHIGILPEPNEQRRLAIEADLLNAHRTPCND